MCVKVVFVSVQRKQCSENTASSVAVVVCQES